MASGLRALYPSISPQTAVDYLDTGQGTDGGDSRGPDQARRIDAWLRASSLCVPKSAFASGFVGSGAEHDTYFDPIGLLAVKLTHDGRYGHCLREEGARSTPLDYFRRLAWHNTLFGDDILLHGLLLDSAGLRLVTSQSWIASHPAKLSPSQDEIDAFLHEFGFYRASAFPDGFIYYNTEADLVIGDAQPTNVLLDDEGIILETAIESGRLTQPVGRLPSESPAPCTYWCTSGFPDRHTSQQLSRYSAVRSPFLGLFVLSI